MVYAMFYLDIQCIVLVVFSSEHKMYAFSVINIIIINVDFGDKKRTLMFDFLPPSILSVHLHVVLHLA